MRPEIGSWEIDGARSTSLSWARFDFKKTRGTRGLKLLRRVILDNSVSLTLPSPWTDHDLIEQIAKSCQTEIPIESLPAELSHDVRRRARAIFGFPGSYIDRVARKYEEMYWWVSEKGLNMAVRSAPPCFDEMAGRLMRSARRRSETARISSEEYVRIAAALDNAGFNLRDYLGPACREQLSNWAQKNQRRGPDTFTEALVKTKLHWLHRCIKKRLYRAEEKTIK